MSVSIDIAGLRQEGIAVLPSPLAELGSALHVLAEPVHHPGLRGWATAVSARLEPELADRLCEADFLWTALPDLFLPFAGLPGRGTLPGATIAEELDLLDKLSDEQFVAAALEFTTCGGPDTEVLGDPELRERALELSAARGPRQVRFTRRLFEDPPAVRAWFRQLVRDCEDAFFADTWARVKGRLTADARHKTEVLRHKGLAGMLAEVSPAVTLDEKGTRITIDKLWEGRTTAGDGGLVFIPTSLGWPHLLVLHRRDWQPVVHYPVSAPGTVDPPSVEQLTLRLTALAHPVRTQLCRHLARGAFTTSELADAHGMTAPEISRHLSVLKKAGLVTTRRRGRYAQHQLDLTAVARLGSDFIEGVLR
ncbi:DUF5937 family protein [Streptomyces sp. S.PNR 29]|uniref:DUF5937 family protein n=1 Tax=Streptomyces sp. S.PNR 29 TaxID=2973805 RepID=UPI0025AFD041|nr:DUF5937 family protein [Streptomyces sp. S.PNR 29]MDN0198027.1 DUF5937 family protein [Streptomyces sp. S.PNR 29]